MTGTTADFGRMVDELGRHASVATMAQAVVSAAEAATAARSTKFPLQPQPGLPLAGNPEQDASLWSTEWGNCWEILQHGAKSAEQVALVRGLLALGLKHQFPSTPEQEQTTAAMLLWLATHTSCRAFEPLELVLGEQARALWHALGSVLEDPTRGSADFGRTERLIAAVSLREAKAPSAREIAREVAARLDDPLLTGVLESGEAEGSRQPLIGELSPAPKNPWVTAVLALTFILAISHVSRLVARYVFAYKRPAKLVLSQRGLEVTSHVELLGRTLREHATLVPLSNLASVTREVRFARLGMYAGLVALVIGSYVGMGLFIDGVRVPGGSATLLGLAVLFILLGLVIDFALSSLSDSVKGKCRILVIPRKGRAVCIGALRPADADAVLASLAEQVRV